jgi:hypothetical protein
VPTPFYHLFVAENLLAHPGLPPAARSLLLEERGAFLFGNTAPDVQVVSGHKRQATHFFSLPIGPDATPAWEQILRQHPSLGQAAALPPAQAAFLAGYLCHLQADWFWILEIFFPIFGPDETWATFHHRLYLHNVLRAYLDRKVMPSLPGATARRLKSIRPDGWLPFEADRHLLEWCDYLAEQLVPGAAARTVEVFAVRQGIPPEDFYRLIESEDAMDEQIFGHLPRSDLDAYYQRLVDRNLELLAAYLGPSSPYQSMHLAHPRDIPGRSEKDPL